MMKKLLFAITASLALLALASCGTSNVGAGGPAFDANGHLAASFHLDVLPETYDFGASAASFSLAANPELSTDSHLVVDVNVADAHNLKGLYLKLNYDPQQYHAMVVEPAKELGNRSDVLTLMALEQPGVMQYGQTLVHQDLQVGFSGSGAVAHISFRKEAEPTLHTVSVAPGPQLASQISDLVFDGVDTLTWTYAFQGDYGQDGAVSVADLQPIGLHFKEVSPAGLGNAWPIAAVQSQIDGDSNGEINVADLQPVGVNISPTPKDAFGGFHVFKSASVSDYPSPPTGANGAGATELGIKTQDNSWASADNAAQKSTQRLHFTFTIAAPVANDVYWVRAFDGGGAAGIASVFAGGNPAALPALSLDPATPTAPTGGTGTQADPYIVDETVNYNFLLLDAPGGTDVSTDPSTVFSTTPNAGTFNQQVLDITTGFTGDFVVTAVTGTPPVQNHPSTNVYLHVGAVIPTTAPFIQKDPADTDWTGVTGTGVDEPNAYILHTSTFNTADAEPDGAFDLVFSLQATAGAGGAVIANNTLNWDCFPPFTVADVAAFQASATAGTFQVWSLSNGYLFAQDPAQPGTPGKSNDLYVASSELPN